MRSIEIDLDVHRAIENARTTFHESENAILRRLLAIDPRFPKKDTRPRPRVPRSSGAYSTVVAGKSIEANSLKELLRRTLLMLEKMRPGFLRLLADQPTPRGRHVVARTAAALYPNSPHLAVLAERVNDDWWFDTNVSKRQLEAYFGTFAHLARLSDVPTISKRAEKSVLTLEDLDLA